MSKYACVDVGGTFTDSAIYDENGEVFVFKSPTTPQNFTEGIINVLKDVSEFYNLSLDGLLKDLSAQNGGYFTHGSTVATNSILERKTGKVGVICTEGFRDVLLFREGPFKDPYNYKIDFPEPFVPRYLMLPVKERIDSEGGVVEKLDENGVVEATKQLEKYDVEAIVVCFLWSIVNDKHEIKAKKIIQDTWPGVPVILSSSVNPIVNEYRRWISAAMDASLKKIIFDYTENLNDSLVEKGFIGEVGMLNSFGGLMTTKEIGERPLYSIDSGPSLAPIAGKKYVETELGESNAVVLDMGGTTFDVSCVIDGAIAVSKEMNIGDEIPGINRVSVHSIGAGGGSIAWVDQGGMLRVGPESAGSFPGPACYNLGGKMPTVTDANLLLGYLNPEYFNEGKTKLYTDNAYKAIKDCIADKLKINVYEAAYAIWATINANMVSAIKDVTVWQGVDPRNFVMVAGGGACGIHAIALAEGLEMKKTLIPKMAGGLSAVGGLVSDKVSEHGSSYYTETRAFEQDEVTKIIKDLYEKAIIFLNDNKISTHNRQIQLYFDGRYPSQAWDLTVMIDGNLTKDFCFDEPKIRQLEQLFHNEHERTFGIKDDTYVNCFSWRVKAIGKPEREVKFNKYTSDETYKISHNFRDVFFGGFNKKVSTPIFKGFNLLPGNKVKGPAIIEEPTTTIIVLPEFEMKVTPHGNYYIESNEQYKL